MELTIFTIQGKKAGTLNLTDARWEGPANRRLLAQVIHMYRSNQRAGTASTKTRGNVSGGGKKPWKQKHTGRARAGSIRSPLWRHGGVVFGPHPRHFGYQLPKAIRRNALVESLKGKLQDQELVVVEAIQATEPKTKPFAKLAETFDVTRRSIIVVEEFTKPVVRSLRNLAAFDICRAADLNAFDVINAQKVLVTKTAFEQVQRRVTGDEPTKASKRRAPQPAGAA